MQDVCWNFLKHAILNPGQRLHRAHVITTTSGRNAIVLSDVIFNFLLIAKMQQHDSAREPGLHFAASPNAPRIKIKSSFQLYTFYIKELMKKGPELQPGHCSTIGKHHPSQHELLT